MVMVSLVIIPIFNYFFWLIKGLLVSMVAVTAWYNYRKPHVDKVLILDERGKISVENGHEWERFELISPSVVSDWFCMLRMKAQSPFDQSPFKKATEQHIWIWRDAMDEYSYRRVCRVINRIRSGQ